MATRSPEYLAWLEEMLTEHARALQEHPEWVPADEYQAAVDEALDWQTEAHADREFYDNA